MRRVGRARRSAVVAASAVVLALAVVVGGCEAIVGSGLPAYTCTGTDPDACPAGSFCSAGACIPCETLACVGEDGGPDGNPVDGAPSEAASDGSPDVPSLDSATDVADVAGDVASDVVADGKGDAVADGSADAIADAPADVMGDARLDAPLEAGCGGLGCACTVASDCNGGICGNANVLGTTFTSANGSLCTQTCCTSADCPSGDVCYGSGNAGNYCVAATALGRPATQGTSAPGAICQDNGDCRSGSCELGVCVDLCCAATDCSNGTSCALDSVGIDGHEVFACLPTAGVAPHATCSVSANCASEDCVSGTCRPPCCGVASCMTAGFGACELATVGQDSVYSCTYPSGAPTGSAVGQTCTKATDCATRACDTTAGTCTAPCCTDADCATYGSYVCRPAGAAPYNLICSKT